MIDEVSIEIGGQTIDKHYGDWLIIWNELTQTAEKQDGYDWMIGNKSDLTSSTVDDIKDATTLYIPLQFWFCRNPGLALPLIALQYHEVKFNITFASFATVHRTDDSGLATPSLDASLYVDYIYLDTDERRQFAQVQHEYLIEQLQFTGAESVSSGTSSIKSKLALNHPCKELVWVVHEDDNEPAVYSGSGSNGNSVVDAKLQLNGQDRFSTRSGDYFNLVQPYQHHTRIPSDGIYVYSFALNPEQHQPSGTVNMSRIDNATLQLSTNVADDAKLRVYAVNYNVLRIMAGMGGLIKMGLKVSLETNLLVKFFITLRHYQTAGNSLESKLPLCLWKHYKGPRLITVPNGKNVWNWTIRSQAPKIVMIMVKVQRLNDSGSERYNLSDDLRYSLVPGFHQAELSVVMGENPLNTPKGGVYTCLFQLNYLKNIQTKLNIFHYLNQIMKNYYKKVQYQNQWYKVVQDTNENVFVIDDALELPENRFYKNNSTGYIYFSNGKSAILLHHLVKSYNGTSVDHINQIKTDNRKVNLRYATQTQQNKNQMKRKRNVKLPEGCGINPNDIPTFIWYIKDNGNHGDRWMVEIKDKYNWKTTSSKEYSTKLKFELAKKHLRELIKKQPELFDGHCINGELNQEGCKLKLEYIEILRLAGYNYEDRVKSLCLYEDIIGLTEKEVVILHQDVDTTKNKNLPSNMSDIVIPKYCYYISATKAKGDGFCCTKLHPKQKESGKDWTTTKSKKVSINDKFKQLLDYLNEK